MNYFQIIFFFLSHFLTRLIGFIKDIALDYQSRFSGRCFYERLHPFDTLKNNAFQFPRYVWKQSMFNRIPF